VYCYEDPKLLKLFSAVIRILYDNDILDEDTIKFWYKKGSHAKVRRARLPQLLDLESRTLCLRLERTLCIAKTPLISRPIFPSVSSFQAFVSKALFNSRVAACCGWRRPVSSICC